MAAAEMNLYIYNTSFSLIAIVDKYISLIWTDRYDDCGDFELSLPYESKWKSVFKKDYFCKIDFSDHWCLIEKIEIDKDEDNAATMIVSGRSIESILERRVVIGKKEFGTDEKEVSVQNSIKTLMNENFISPSNSKRKISNFTFSESSASAVTGLKFADSYEGQDILSIVTGVCQDKHIGFKLLLDSSNNFVFSLYAGKDRSQSSNSTGYVIFSPYYDNLITSNYYSSSEEYRNLMVVCYEENKYYRVYTSDSEPSGLSLREVYEDASSLEDYDTDMEVSDKKLIMTKSSSSGKSEKDRLKSKAKKKLKREYKIKTGFEGDIIPEKLYKYRTNFNTGDKVQFQDAYGNSERVYISEVVISMDENGLVILPTFAEIDWE